MNNRLGQFIACFVAIALFVLFLAVAWKFVSWRPDSKYYEIRSQGVWRR